MLRLLVVLALVGVVLVLVWVGYLATRRVATDPALLVVRRVRELAWDHRDIDPVLASALIERISVFEARGQLPSATLDDLLEIAWQHRDTEPGLSVLVVDLIRSDRRGLEG